MLIAKIVSGGQTGVDRGGFAAEGSCGRAAEVPRRDGADRTGLGLEARRDAVAEDLVEYSPQCRQRR